MQTDLFAPVEVIAPPMTPTEAQDWKSEVGSTASSLRNLLFDGYERQAWKALGFNTWTDCLAGLADEYGFTERRLWQLHAANQTEQRLLNNCSVGAIPEGQLRPLAALPPAQQREAWERVLETAPNGKITAAIVIQAAQAIRQERTDQRRQERIEKIVQIAQGNSDLAETAVLYPIVYVDPPWRYEYSPTDNREIENHYPTMTLEEICLLPVAEIATPDSVLFLWTTSPKLAESMQVIEAWSYTYKTCMVWDKERMGMGYYARQQHELLLIATRGAVPVPDPANRPPSVIRARRDNEHSAKPAEFYEVIERMYPDLPKIELFARNRRTGWAAWGNEA